MMRCRHLTSLGIVLLALLEVASTSEPRQPTHVVTLPQGDRASPHAIGPAASLSTDGRYVAFVSQASLVPADTNHAADIYVLDTATGEVTLETLPSNGDSDQPSLDGSGRYLVFRSLVAIVADAQLTAASHVFLRDRVERTTRLLSIGRDRRPPTDPHDVSLDPVISLDGGTVAFASNMTTIVAGDDCSRNAWDIYVVRLATGDIQRVSAPGDGADCTSGMSLTPSLSGDGRFVAFSTRGGRAAQGRIEVYVHDTQTGQTRRVARAANGGEPNGASLHPAISADGRFIAFASDASNLMARDGNRTTDVFVADLDDGSIELVSRTPRGRPGNGTSNRAVISGDGSLIAFQSEASDLICTSRCAPHERDINMVWDVFVHDRRRGTTVRLSADEGPEWMESSGSPVLAAVAPIVAFSSRHPPDSTERTFATNAYVVRTLLDTLRACSPDQTPRATGQR